VVAKPLRREEQIEFAPFPVGGVTRTGVLPIGFADGMALLHSGEVLVHGHRAAILGPVSAEHTRVDLTAVPEAQVGDEVVIIGSQGGERIAVEDVGRHQGLGSPALVALSVRETINRVYLPARPGS
jgi:alanine racemase